MPGKLKTHLRALIGGLLITTAGASVAVGAEISGDVVRIGVVNDQTGFLSDPTGKGSVIATQMAVEDFKPEAHGLKVEVVSADHQNKPDVGATIVRKWIDVDGVDLIADVGNSAVALAIQSIIREKNRIAVYSAVATTEVTGRQCVPTGLSWLHDAYNLVAGPIRDLVPKGQKTWFFIGADYAFGRNMVSVSQTLLAAAGGKSLGEVFHPSAETDYTSYLLQAQASGADTIGFASTGSQLVTEMKQWTEFGMTGGPQKPVAGLLFLTDTHSMGLSIAAGLRAVTAWYWDLNDETRAFAQRFYKLHGAMPSEAQASMYSAVGHYLKGVAATGTDDTDKVLAWMRANPVDDFYAPGATLRGDSRLVHDFYLVEVKTPAESKGPWDVYKVLSTIKPKDAYPSLAESECPLVKTAAAR
ncbi:ABC transporter substrate-binding protein [Methylobacterium mesophilicum]